MAFFNDFKDLFTSAAQSVSNKTRDGVESARIAGECRGIANDLANLYEQIGRSYVDSKGADSDTMNALCARAMELRERLEALERQRLMMKNQYRCPSCGAAAAKDARFCSACGRRMPDEAPAREVSSPAEQAQYCPECGAMRAGGDRYCPVCGHGTAAEADEKPAETQPEVFEVKMVRPKPPAAADDEAPADFEAD